MIESFDIDMSIRKQCGDWAFVRYLRNQGLPLNAAYFIMFGRKCPVVLEDFVEFYYFKTSKYFYIELKR